MQQDAPEFADTADAETVLFEFHIKHFEALAVGGDDGSPPPLHELEVEMM
jgi:hypothetical protein